METVLFKERNNVMMETGITKMAVIRNAESRKATVVLANLQFAFRIDSTK